MKVKNLFSKLSSPLKEAFTLVVVLLLLLTSNSAAAIAPNHTHSMYLKEYVNQNTEIAYYTVQAKVSSNLLNDLNKTLYSFFVTSVQAKEKLPYLQMKIKAFADYNLVGNLGVFRSYGTNESYIPETWGWVKSLNINMSNNRIYGLKDLFDQKIDYKSQLETMLSKKSDGYKDLNAYFNISDMIQDGSFEVTPDGINFYCVYVQGLRFYHPHYYYSVLLKWHEIEGLLNKQGEFWQLIKSNINLQVSNDYGLDFDQWGYAQAPLANDPNKVNIINSKNEVIASVIGLQSIVSPKTALIRTPGDQTQALVGLFDASVLCPNVTSEFSEGVATFAPMGHEKVRYGYIDCYGKITIPARFIAAFPFRNGQALVQQEDRSFALINYQGKVQSKLRSNIQAQPDSTTTFVYKEGSTGKYGAIDSKNKIILKPIYNQLQFISKNGQFIATTAQGIALIDYNGKRLTDLYKSIKVAKGNTFSAVTFEGKALTLTSSGYYSGFINQLDIEKDTNLNHE